MPIFRVSISEEKKNKKISLGIGFINFGLRKSLGYGFVILGLGEIVLGSKIWSCPTVARMS